MIQHSKHMLWCLLLPGIVSHGQAASQGTPPAKPSVEVYVIVSEKSVPPPIPTLSQFSVSVDSQPAQLASLRSANEDRLRFALLVDISASDYEKATLIKHVASELFQRLSDGGNEGNLVLFNSQIAMSKHPLQPSEVQRALDSVQFRGPTALYDAIGDTCTKILSRSGNPGAPRRAIFLITDGEDNSGHLSREGAEEAAEREGVAIFFLQTGFDQMSGAEKRQAVRFLNDASNDTGGQAIQAKNLEEDIPLLIDAIHSQWAVRLLPVQAFDQNMHSLAIKSEEKSVKISAPKRIPLQ